MSWKHIPRTQEQIRRARVGNVRIEIGLMYPDNFRDWRVHFYFMRPGLPPTSWFATSATGTETEVRARAEALALAFVTLKGASVP